MVLGHTRRSPSLSSRPRRRPRAVLVFGENENDTKAIREFIEALLPGTSLRIEPRRRPPINLRDAPPNAVPNRVAAIARIIAAEEVDLDVVAVVAHEDCDAVEPSHVKLTDKIESAFRAKGQDKVRAATPAWEMETWLMQWPDAFKLHVPSWRPLNTTGRNVGVISNAKEFLAHALEQPGGRGREYRESDAPTLARIVREQGWIESPKATSASFSMFADRARAVGA